MKKILLCLKAGFVHVFKLLLFTKFKIVSFKVMAPFHISLTEFLSRWQDPVSNGKYV